MASIVFYSAAYRGDVYPYAPLANELSRRGHRVTFVVPEEFHADFAAEDFTCADHGSDFSPKTLNLPEHTEFVRKWGMRANGVFLLRLYMGKLTVPYLDDMYAALKGAAEDVDVDLFVSHPAASTVAQIVADKMDKPWVSGDLFPMLRATTTRPPPGLPDLGERINGLIWKSASSSLYAPVTYERKFHDFREKVGLPRGGESMVDMMMSPHLNLGMASPHYVPTAPDWPSNYHQIGFCFWPGPGGGELAPEVVDFLDQGTPPVVVTLGTSAAAAHPERFLTTLRLLEARGERGLFLTSTEGVADDLQQAVVDGGHGAWPFVPLMALLPHAKAVVHSGAHGTNALALAAGLPSVIMPSLFDQVWHGKRQEELGTGVLVRKDAQLAPAMDRLVSDATMAGNAQQLAARMADENGPSTGADHIEQFLNR